MKILNKIIVILFNKKFSFRRLKKKSVLIYDKLSLRELKDLIPSKKIEVLDSREEINLLIILKMLMNLKFSKNYYYKFYLNTVSPNLIITTSDHDIFFYKIKEIYPYAKTAIIQLSYRHNKFGDLFSILKNKKIKKKYKIDYIFCFGADFAKEYKKYINGKAITIGSVRNNKLIKFKKKKRTISFISQFRNRSKTNEDYIFHRWKNKKLMHSEFFSLEKKLIPLIADFCKKKNYKLRIIGCARNKESEEKKFYKMLINDLKWTYLSPKKPGTKSTYKWLNESSINIFTESTLGFESLARGIKTISFYARKSLNHNAYFGWPSKKKARGYFWTNEITTSEVKRLMTNIISINNKKWLDLKEKTTSSIITLDEDNKILKNFLNKF